MAAQPTAAKITQPMPSPDIIVSGVFIPKCKAYSDYQPRTDKQLAGIRVTIKNNSKEIISVNPLYFFLVDKDGGVVKPELGSCDDQIETTRIGPGQAIRGMVGYQIDPGTVAASVQYVFVLDAPVIGPVTLE